MPAAAAAASPRAKTNRKKSRSFESGEKSGELSFSFAERVWSSREYCNGRRASQPAAAAAAVSREAFRLPPVRAGEVFFKNVLFNQIRAQLLIIVVVC